MAGVTPLQRDSLWISADAVETPYFESSLHSLETLDDAMCDRLSPLAYQIQLVDLLGRVHALQAQRVNIESPREFDAFRDQARTLSAAVKRCYTSIPDRVLNPSATTDAPPNILSCILVCSFYKFVTSADGISTVCDVLRHLVEIVCTICVPRPTIDCRCFHEHEL